MPLLSAQIGETVDESFAPVRLDTGRGSVDARLYPAPGPAPDGRKAAGTPGVIWLGGVGGGFDSPARGLYPRLAKDLAADGIASLRIRYRNPRALNEAVHDTLCGLTFFGQMGIHHVALVGHSFGGAVAIQAAASNRGAVWAVATLATQGLGTDAVADLSCPVLLIHGEGDEVLTPMCSIHVHRMAREPKKLVLMPGAGHCLDETAESVCHEVRGWLKAQLLER